jgi:hypothetical protein
MNFPTIVTPSQDQHWKVQTASFGNQVPFYFGGSSVPAVIGIPKVSAVKTDNITLRPSLKINQQLLRY